MDKKIIVKRIDTLKSTTHKNREINEYLISVAIDNAETQIEAYTEFGEDAKRFRVNDMLVAHNLINEDLEHIIIETK